MFLGWSLDWNITSPIPFVHKYQPDLRVCGKGYIAGNKLFKSCRFDGFEAILPAVVAELLGVLAAGWVKRAL
jgi:hypothetical protein